MITLCADLLKLVATVFDGGFVDTVQRKKVLIL